MIRAIVTDIEGTTSSLSFVKDTLFPYAREHLPAYVRAHEKTVSAILDEVRATENNLRLSTEEIIAILLRWIDEDRKATPLKALQGMIWEAGYKAGDFQGHIYDDALKALQHWHEAGIALYVYSSGSIPAQKLLFAHTAYGNLTNIFSGYFDTATGPKMDAESYKKITAQINIPAASILFLSDSKQEIAAASAAGMRVVLVDRQGEKKSHETARNFYDIVIKERAA